MSCQCFGNDKVDSFICRILVKQIEDANYDRLDPLFALVPSILMIEDSIADLRTERYLNPRTGLIAKAAYFRAQYPLFTYCLLKFILLTLGRMEGRVKQFLLVRNTSAPRQASVSVVCVASCTSLNLI